jgi:hypothetical protein
MITRMSLTTLFWVLASQVGFAQTTVDEPIVFDKADNARVSVKAGPKEASKAAELPVSERNISVVKVTPNHGISYQLGDDKLSLRSSQNQSQSTKDYLRVPTWTIGRF